MGDFRKLIAWQKSQAFVGSLNRSMQSRKAASFPGLRVQLLRAAAAIPANLAEGCGRRTQRELAQYARIAHGSAKEVQSHLVTARNVDVLSAAQFDALSKDIDEIARLTYGLSVKAFARSESD
jgi:four helix bundle protein